MAGYAFVAVFIVAIIAIAICVFDVRCNPPLQEGYIRSCLGSTCRMNRSPVDYAMKSPCGWQRNPHWQANPGNEHQPLEYGPIDFYPDSRRMDANDGVLFQQYGNDWRGCGRDEVYLVNDEKGRFDMTNVGDVGARRVMDDLPTKRWAPGYPLQTEMSHVQPRGCDDKIYGGSAYLIHDNLGD